MNSDQITGIFRAAIPTIAMLLGVYYLDSATWTIILTSVGTVIAAVWSFSNNRPVALLNSAANQLPQGSQLVMVPRASAPPSEQAVIASLVDRTNDNVQAKLAA